MKLSLLLISLLLIWPLIGQAHPVAIPKYGVAYTSHGAIVVKNAAGKTVRKIRTTIPIGSFAISPNKKNIVFAPPGEKCSASGLGRQGGPLYLLVLSTDKSQRLLSTQTRIYDKQEVYADPDFSPEGNEIVFAIHRESCGDAVITAGPYAVLDLQTQSVKVLTSTIDPSGSNYGPAYGFNPQWSPDGRLILVNFNDTFDVTTPSSKHLLGVSRAKNWISMPVASSGMEGIGWLGDKCVVFIAGKGGEEPAYVLNLRTHRTEFLSKLLGVSSDQTTNLVAFSPHIWVRRFRGNLVAETKHGSWVIATVGQNRYVRVISSPTDEQAPLVCR